MACMHQHTVIGMVPPIFLINKPHVSVALALLSRSTLIVFAVRLGPLHVCICADNTGNVSFSVSLQVEDARSLLNMAFNMLEIF